MVDFHEKLPEASPCLTEPIPASCKADLALAKAGPNSDRSSTSGIMCLRRQGKNGQETKVCAEEVGGDTSGAEQREFWEGFTLEMFRDDRGIPFWSTRKCTSPRPEEEESVETTFDELIAAPVPNSPVLMRVDGGLGGRENKELN